jgi:hypothetical protein
MLQKMEQMDGGRKPSKLLADMHGVLSYQIGAESNVPLPLHSEGTPGLADTVWRGGDCGNPRALAARAGSIGSVFFLASWIRIRIFNYLYRSGSGSGTGSFHQKAK